MAFLLASGCSGSDGSPQVDSDLMGVYQVTSYRGSQTDCDQPEAIEPSPSFIVLYSFVPNEDPDEALLGGLFCGSVELCRQAAAEAPEPQIGYSFTQGSDDSGWLGWAISSAGAQNDQCEADVQAHVLTSTNPEDINIETETVVAVFEPRVEDNTAICSNRDALLALDEDLPCSEILILEATFEAGL